MTILPRITVDELHCVVASHIGLQSIDRHLFGLVWIDESTKQYHWLSGDKKLMESEIPSSAKGNGGKIVLHHNVKFFVDHFSSLADVSTVQLYFLDTQQQLAREQLDLSVSDHLQLASLLIHIFNGDYTDDSSSIDLLRIVVPLPHRLSKDSIVTESEWETKVLDQYRNLEGLPRGTAIIKFMEIAERSPTYGSRFFRVQDQSTNPCVLALNSKGIMQYDRNDLSSPRRVFHWRHIENIYYKECHFSIEVTDSRSIVMDTLKDVMNDMNHESRSIGSLLFTFIVDSSSSCRSLWSSSIQQHQFYLDQSIGGEDHNRNSQSSSSREVDHLELCDKLNRLVSKSSLAPSIHSLSSFHNPMEISNISSSKIVEGSMKEERDDNCDEEEEDDERVNDNEERRIKEARKVKSDEEKKVDIVRYNRFMELKRQLSISLAEKLAELRKICIAEGELTGVLPFEIRSTLRPGEEEPKIKRRIGTSFILNADLFKLTKVDRVLELETEVEINRKIVAAADRLAKDKSTNKSVRKKRQKDLALAQSKLRGLENNLQQMRLSSSKPDVSIRDNERNNGRGWNSSSISRSTALTTSKSCPTTPRGSMPDLVGAVTDGEEDDDDHGLRPSSCSLGGVDNVASTSSMNAMTISSVSVSSSSAAPSGTSSSSLTSNSSMGTGRSIHMKSSSLRYDRDRDIDHLDDSLRVLPLTLPSYESMGYRSCASYKSSYRTVHYPTLQETEDLRKSDHELDDIPTRMRSSSVKSGGVTGWEPYQNCRSSNPIRVHHPSHKMIMNDNESSSSFSSGSLDRRINKRLSSPSMDHSSSRDSSPSTQRITTFPVSNNAPFVFRKTIHSQQSVPLLQSISPSFHLQGPSPSSLLSRIPQSSLSTSKLPSQTDPHMEALIEFYRERHRKTPKTATIV